MKIKKYKASILVVTLLILAVVLMIALTVSLISIKQRQASLGAGKSNMAFQNADTGVEEVMNKLLKNQSIAISSISGLSCSVPSGSNNAVIAGSTYNAELRKKNYDPANSGTYTTCSTLAFEIASIKSTGVGSNQEARAVEAAVKTQCVAPDANTMGYWKFDTFASGVTPDSTSNANDGTLTGTSNVTGLKNTALKFNGTTSDFVNLGNANSSLQFTGDGTVEAWVKLDSSWSGSTSGTVFQKQSDSSTLAAWGMLLQVSGAKNVKLTTVSGSSSVSSCSSLVTLTTGAWYNIVGVRDTSGTSMYIYINGALDNTCTGINTGALRSSSLSSNPSAIGAANITLSTPVEPFNGIIDEVRVSNKVRDINYVKQNYACLK